MLIKVISGGQTGCDRAGLEAGRKAGLLTGGWCPLGFMTSEGADLSLSVDFGLKELPGGTSLSQMYVMRSMKNVDESDGTVAFRMKPSLGTDKTIGYCLKKRWSDFKDDQFDDPSYKPCLMISHLDESCVDDIVAFVSEFNIRVLNIAGHRSSESAGVEGFSKKVEDILFKAFTKCKN